MIPRMHDFDTLVQIAHHRERVASRRLARQSSLSDHDALMQTLRISAASLSITLDALVAARRKEQARARSVASERNERKARVKAALKERKTFLEPDAWHAWFDGSAHPNPGKIGIGGLLRGPANEVQEISAMAGHGDSCTAEYLALIAVLEAALPHKPAKLLIHGDSRVVIDDIIAQPASRSRLLTTYSDRAHALIDELKRSGEIAFEWIPRARNALADALSQRAIAGDSSHATSRISRISTTGESPNESPSA
jgi:ribonuclease HI